MRYFCTSLTGSEPAPTLALHASLLRHAGPVELTALCLDEAALSALQALARPGLRLLPLTELLAAHPELAAVRAEHTSAEFALICRPWLLHHVLPQLPAGEHLAFIATGFYFFSALQPTLDQVNRAPAALLPGVPGSHRQFRPDWISLRHDATGLACVAAWARDAARGFAHDVALQLNRWPINLPGTLLLSNLATIAAPWDLGGHQIGPGPTLDGRTLLAFDFSQLSHLDQRLFDPGLARYGIPVTPELRAHLYRPYLHALTGSSTAEAPPDIVPPENIHDPRCAGIVATLAERTLQAERARTNAESALGKIHAEAQARTAESERYARQVELDRDEQRKSFFATRQRLEEIHQDLLHNIAYLKKLEAEAAAAQQASVDREAYVASLKEQLATQSTDGGGGVDLAQLHQALLPHGAAIHRLLVARYHPALLPMILSLAAQGVNVEVLGSPATLAGQTRGAVHFLGGDIWDWLGGLSSLFDEPGYLRANPDVAAAIGTGAVRSGWDHYLRFGQHEGRATGIANFRTGLADFDAVAFDSSDAGPIVPCLVGRLQPHHRLFVSSSFNPATVWLPGDTSRTIVLGDLLCCPRPPNGWLGPRLPTALPGAPRTSPGVKELYPDVPAQPAVWPKITVVTVSHNQSAALEATLRSVLDQHYPMLEYLVVDAASTDNSPDLIRRHADRLAWWTSEPCTSHTNALAKAFAKATGSIVTWLNPGDRLAPASLFTVAQQSLLHVPDILAGRCLLESADGSAVVHRSVLTLGRMQPLPLRELQDVDNFWFKNAFFLQPGVFVTRAAWDRVGGFGQNIQHALDYDLWLRLARHGARVLPLPEILACQGPTAVLPSVHSEIRALSAASSA